MGEETVTEDFSTRNFYEKFPAISWHIWFILPEKTLIYVRENTYKHIPNNLFRA